MIKTFDWKKEFTLGIARDEALLAGALVSSVGVFAAVATPWDAVLQNTMGRSLNLLTEIEVANQGFYDTYHIWPTEAARGNANGAAAVLVSKRGVHPTVVLRGGYRQFLEDIPYDMVNGRPILRHTLGQGGTILQEVSDNPAYEQKIILRAVPYSVARSLDQEIDGKANFEDGRVLADPRGGLMDVIYYANPVASDLAER